MEETLVSYEVAKLAKEKGFNLPSMNFYTPKEHLKLKQEGKKLFRYGSAGEELHSARIYRNRDLHNSKNDIFTWLKGYTAPSQSLLQKWLRERHKIFINVAPHFSLTTFALEVYNGNAKDKYTTIGADTKFDTYEKALEKGLKESLKILEDSELKIEYGY